MGGVGEDQDGPPSASWTYIKHETEFDLKTLSDGRCSLDSKVLKRIRNQVKKGNVKKIQFKLAWPYFILYFLYLFIFKSDGGKKPKVFILL